MTILPSSSTVMKSFLILSLAALAAASSHDLGLTQSRRHHELAARVPEPEPEPNNNATHFLAKRDFSGRASWYDVGLGACGKVNKPSDHIVALNSAQYGNGYPGPECFKAITITYQGKSVGATIMDECPGCPYGGLDMSKGLFQEFTGLGTGIFYMTWFFDGESSPPPPPKPKPSSTHKPSPSPTHHSTSTHHQSSPTSEPSTSSHKSSTTHKHSSSTSTSASGSPTGTPTPTGPNNLIGLEQAIFDLAGLLNAAHPNTNTNQ